MPGMTNSDNGMMGNQQAEDLGHPVEQDATPAVKGASVESPMPRLGQPLDADGLLEEGDETPDAETEVARKASVAQLSGRGD